MCKEPVTFGGGSAMVYGSSFVQSASKLAWKTPCSSPCEFIPLGLYVSGLVGLGQLGFFVALLARILVAHGGGNLAENPRRQLCLALAPSAG